MRTWAILPVKPLNRAKSRLAGVLSPENRTQLAMNMLVHTINTLQRVQAISGVLVISRDSKVLSVARDQGKGVFTIQESGQPELNSALMRATQLLNSWGAETTLVLPTDIPLLAVDDIEKMLHIGRYTPSVVIAPDRQRDGTNALLTNPSGIIVYSYGPGSFERHCSQAQLVGAELHVFESERIALDVDTPDDLLIYQQMAHQYHMPMLNYSHESEYTNDIVPYVEDLSS